MPSYGYIDVSSFPRAVRAPLAELADRLVDGATLLLAATGSLANGSWRAGWSDVDVLLIRRDLPLAWLADRTRDLVTEPVAHVSAFSAAEVGAGLLPPRVINAVRLVAEDSRGVIVRDDSWVAPEFDLDIGARASLLDLPQALLLLRRHVMDGVCDVRAVYKLAILVARIILRQAGVEPDTGDDVIAAFAGRCSASAGWLPNVDVVAQSSAIPETRRLVAAGAQRILQFVEDQRPWTGADRADGPS